jgi:hypothetical protein
VRDENQSDTGITNDERGKGTGSHGSCQLTSPCIKATTSPTSPPANTEAAAPEPCPTTPLNCADASEHQAASKPGEPRPSQRVPDMNPSTSRSEPRTSPENEPEQDDRAARLGELLARADQAAQRIAAQQAERQASSEYAARMELEAQTQAEVGQQAEARDEVELELLCRSASALPDEPVDQIIYQGYRLCLTAACIGQDPAR